MIGKKAMTEAEKYDGGKPRIDLIPPEFLLETAKCLGFGAGKYTERNWEQGMDWSRVYASLMRHMLAFWAGEDIDKESGLSHLSHASCCVAFLIAFQNRNIGNDDRPKYDID